LLSLARGLVLVEEESRLSNFESKVQSNLQCLKSAFMQRVSKHCILCRGFVCYTRRRSHFSFVPRCILGLARFEGAHRKSVLESGISSLSEPFAFGPTASFLSKLRRDAAAWRYAGGRAHSRLSVEAALNLRSAEALPAWRTFPRGMARVLVDVSCTRK
jgi:hypothetical protein